MTLRDQVALINKQTLGFQKVDPKKGDPELSAGKALCSIFNIHSIHDVLKLYETGFIKYTDDMNYNDVFSLIYTDFMKGEVWFAADIMAATGRGDCEDVSRLQCFIYKALGLTPFLIFIYMHPKNSEGTMLGHAISGTYDNEHIYVQDFSRLYITKIPINVKKSDGTIDRDLVAKTALAMYANEMAKRGIVISESVIGGFKEWNSNGGTEQYSDRFETWIELTRDEIYKLTLQYGQEYQVESTVWLGSPMVYESLITWVLIAGVIVGVVYLVKKGYMKELMKFIIAIAIMYLLRPIILAFIDEWTSE